LVQEKLILAQTIQICSLPLPCRLLHADGLDGRTNTARDTAIGFEHCLVYWGPAMLRS
jgi:hypothetical protein